MVGRIGLAVPFGEGAGSTSISDAVKSGRDWKIFDAMSV